MSRRAHVAPPFKGTHHSIAMTRDAAAINRKLTLAVKARQADVLLLPDEVLAEWEAAYRDEAESASELADALRAEIDSR
jgi:hypothetical protein